MNEIIDSDEKFHFVSQEGSSISLIYQPNGNPDEIGIPPIYPNKYSNQELGNCKSYKLYTGSEYGYVINCILKSGEVDKFKYLNMSSFDENNVICFGMFCGYKEETKLQVFRLDISQYPLFYVYRFIIPKVKILTVETKFILATLIKGNYANLIDKINFIVLSYVEINKLNYTMALLCSITNPEHSYIRPFYDIFCSVENIPSKKNYLTFDSIYLTQITINTDIQYPYEIYIPGVIKGTDDINPEPEPESSFKMKNSIFGIIIVFMLLI